MTGTEPARRIAGRDGWHHVMTGARSSKAIGTDLAAGSNMTIDGIAIAIVITIVVTTTTATPAKVVAEAVRVSCRRTCSTTPRRRGRSFHRFGESARAAA